MTYGEAFYEISKSTDGSLEDGLRRRRKGRTVAAAGAGGYAASGLASAMYMKSPKGLADQKEYSQRMENYLSNSSPYNKSTAEFVANPSRNENVYRGMFRSVKGTRMMRNVALHGLVQTGAAGVVGTGLVMSHRGKKIIRDANRRGDPR